MNFGDDNAKEARAHIMQMFTQHMTKLVERFAA
jgi:hypothetical protein